MGLIYQLWGLKPEQTDWEQNITRFARAEERLPGRIAILGLEAPAEVRRRLIGIARSHGTQVWIWLPVFSELDHLAEFHPLVDYSGRAFPDPQEVKEFCFRCPSDRTNHRPVLDCFGRILSEEEWDGAFFDRVRFPSFQFGRSGVLSCFCNSCRDFFIRSGLDPARLQSACERVEEKIRRHEPNPAGLISFDGTRWCTEDPDLQALLDARCDIITDAMKEITDFSRRYTPGAAFDLFTPALSYFVGQDLRKLLPLADFVKPMMYLQTDAPAGLPYELRVLEDALPGTDFLARFGAETVEEMALQEIRTMNAMDQDGTKICCGIEYTSVPPIVEVTPGSLRHNIPLMRQAGARDFVAAWDFLNTNDDVVMTLQDLAD